MRNLFCGAISLWYGSIAKIPKGYSLCNGENGTPDLQDRFVVGAGDSYNPDNTGGSILHNHTFTGDGHNHGVNGGAIAKELWVDKSTTTTTEAATGTTNNENILPPYKSLAYIMEL